MLRTYLLLILLLFVGGVTGQATTLSQEQLQDTALLVELNNYFGCKVWSGDSCIQCSQRYYFNKNGVCCEVQGTCQQFNQEEGICEKCYEGYNVVDGKCSQIDKTASINIGCALWENNLCKACSKRWYFNADQNCVPVSDLCHTWDESTGACLTCYYGSIVQEGDCVAHTDTLVVSESNLLCKTWAKGTCLECSDRSFFNSDGLCVSISSQCNTFDKASGNCLTCFAGYDLVEGGCAYSPDNTAKPADLGCGTWDWSNQICLACSNKWAFNAEKVCVPVSDQCRTHAENGDCTECFKGYDLIEGQCLYALSNQAKPADLGCGTWDWDNQLCLACSNGWVFNADKICVAVSDQCKDHAENGDCTECFKGYYLQEGKCVFSEFNNAKPAEFGCASWDWDNQICLSCSNFWVFNVDHICIPVSDQCKAHAENGDCTECFKGYDFIDGRCLFSEFISGRPRYSGCATWDWDNQVCLACSKNWVFNSDKLCVSVSDQCKAHSQNGDCTECFDGYDLVEGKCLLSDFNNAKPADSGCGTWDWANQVCLACSKGWVFNADKACVPVSDQCKVHDEAGLCTECFKGYYLSEGKCILSDYHPNPNSFGCATFDWDNQVCLACSKNWVFNSDKVCVRVSEQCKAHDQAGLCTECFKGYDLKEGKCLFSDFNNAKPGDSGCGIWDWQNQVCLKCSYGWVFNSEKVCVPVSDQCKTQADNGDCTSCFKGYDLKEGQCVYSDFNEPISIGCGVWDWDNYVCLQCSKGWVFNDDHVCVTTSDLCRNTDPQTGDCVSCYEGYDLRDGQCIFSDFNNARPADLGCGTWDWTNQVCLKCSHRWFFNANKVCVPVDDNCNSYGDNGSCTTCYPGYEVKGGICVSANPLCKSRNEDGTCASCYPQNILHQGNCVPISKLANILLYYAECCPEKLAELQIVEGEN